VYAGLGTRPEESAGKRSKRGALNGTVIALGLTSFFTDISSEMVAAVVPLFLTTQLGFTPSAFGLFQGIYELANALLRMVGGMVADRTRRPKETAAAGYGFSTLTRLGLVGSVTVGIPAVPFLIADRLGKGLRTSPRDAMISMSTPQESWGTAFGVHRSLDAAGALLGPLMAFGILTFLPGSFDAIFLLSFGFGMLGFAVIVTWVRNPKALSASHTERSKPKIREVVTDLWRNRGYRRVVALGGAFGLFSVGDGFAYLVLFEASKQTSELGVSGFGFRWFPLLFAGTAIVFLATAAPLGRVADRFGRGRVWVAGHAVLAVVYAVLLLMPTSVAGVMVVLALLGIFYGATDGVLPALASGVIPKEQRSSGLALLSTVVALTRMTAAVAFGLIWQAVGVDRALMFAVVGLVLVTAGVTFSAVFRDPAAE